MAEYGQEVHRDTRGSTRSTAGKFLSKRFLEEVFYLSQTLESMQSSKAILTFLVSMKL